jgi:tetratricopeptide (TPR) repeat protein
MSDPTPALSVELSAEAIQNELERILASAKFARARRLRSLLRFTVTQTLQGNAGTLKEYVIGTEVLEKPDTYDPRNDSLVRVLANRLRGKLKEYYSNGGSNDPLVIDFPKGRYVPQFYRREQLDSEVQKKLRARNACSFGKVLATRASEQVLEDAATRFEEAIESDPSFAPAQAGLGMVYAFQAVLGFRQPKARWSLVRARAEAARSLDEMSSEAHICLGALSAFQDHDWAAAQGHFKKAIERDPYCSAGRMWLALASLIPAGNLEAAQRELAQARELAPAPFQDEADALCLYLSGRYEDLLNRASSPSQLPDLHAWSRSCALAELGRLQEAIQIAEQAPERSRRLLAILGYLYGIAGRTDAAQGVLAECAARRERGEWIGNYELALIHAGLARTDPEHGTEALTLLLQASREREAWVAFLSLDPRFRPLRKMQDFVELTTTGFTAGDRTRFSAQA